MNRPNTKNYRKNRRAKRSNPLLVWLFVLIAMLIMVPIQAAEDKPRPQEDTVQQTPEELEEPLRDETE